MRVQFAVKRSGGASVGGRLHVGRPGHALGFDGAFARTPDQATLPAGSKDWEVLSIDAGIADDATQIQLQLAPSDDGERRFWLDDIRIERLGSLADAPYESRFAPLSALTHPGIHAFAVQSPRLSAFWGREITLHAAVVAPTDVDLSTLPICYVIHGFGGNHVGAWRAGPELLDAMRTGEAPKLVHVFLDGSCPLGHHEFADSVNNGPWGAALVNELMPAVEAAYGGERAPNRRFVRGHSSGGWSSLWLQVTYPDLFGGCWASSPDSVDFRDFSGIDLYAAANVYRDAQGEALPLVMRGNHVVSTFEQFTRGEVAISDYGGQISSFDAVFSSRGDDGRPMPFFDRATGAIDRRVIDAWKRYDIGLLLRTRWTELAPKLKGKIHVWCGDEDTFRLQGAVRLLKADLAALGSDADIFLVEGRDHGTLRAPHETLWPKGMVDRQLREMSSAAQATP